jgi:multiple sugar transport system permease protein
MTTCALRREPALPQQSAPLPSARRRRVSGDVAPLLAFVVAIAIYPLLFSFRISLFKYRLTDPNQVQTFIGLDNYLRAISGPDRADLAPGDAGLCRRHGDSGDGIGVGAGAAAASEGRTTRFARSLLLLPMALPPLVVGLVWKSLYNADFGVIPYYLKQLGVDVGRGPLAELNWAMPAVILIDVWQWTPLLMIIFLAGLKSLPVEPYEAAYADGATRWHRFVRISRCRCSNRRCWWRCCCAPCSRSKSSTPFMPRRAAAPGR